MDKRDEIVNILSKLNKKVNMDREKIQNISQKKPAPRDGLYIFIRGVNDDLKRKGLEK